MPARNRRYRRRMWLKKARVAGGTGREPQAHVANRRPLVAGTRRSSRYDERSSTPMACGRHAPGEGLAKRIGDEIKYRSLDLAA
jgi:hypothetical protein